MGRREERVQPGGRGRSGGRGELWAGPAMGRVPRAGRSAGCVVGGANFVGGVLGRGSGARSAASGLRYGRGLVWAGP